MNHVVKTTTELNLKQPNNQPTFNNELSVETSNQQ